MMNFEKPNTFLYLDNNATTPIDPRVLEAMLPFLVEMYANPNSQHSFGIEVKKRVDDARFKVASLIDADPRDIIFTSGSTESINIALKGVARNYSAKGRHIITISTEHKAVIDTCKFLETIGYDVTYLPVGSDGLIELELLKDNLRDDTILVCVMCVNNETGVIQPIKEISAIAHEAGALFMTDATQAAGKIAIDVDALGIDILCLSGHKMYAPKGIGALYVRNGVRLSCFTHSGGHERGIRSGTLNVPGIVALGKACEIAKQEMNQDAIKIRDLRDKLEYELLKINGAFVNGSRDKRIFNVTNICFPYIDANVLIGRMENIAVSNGAACSSAVIEPSHVLTAMGLGDDEAFASIRFSLGKYNTKNEVNLVVRTLNELLNSFNRYA